MVMSPSTWVGLWVFKVPSMKKKLFGIGCQVRVLAPGVVSVLTIF